MLGVSYDSIETLRAFADSHRIAYPLLSDHDSRVIDALGLLDRDLASHQAAFGMPTGDHQQGVAYPALFLIDEQGRVAQKRIQSNYRAREGGPLLLDEALRIHGTPGGPAAEFSDPRVRVRLVADSPAYVRWQKTRLHVEIAVQTGWHVYSNPVSAGYTGLRIAVESVADVEVGEPAVPAAQEFSIAGLDEQFRGYKGNLSAVVPIAFNVGKDHGPVTIRAKVSYQACSSTSCLPPTTTALEITLSEAAVP